MCVHVRVRTVPCTHIMHTYVYMYGSHHTYIYTQRNKKDDDEYMYSIIHVLHMSQHVRMYHTMS